MVFFYSFYCTLLTLETLCAFSTDLQRLLVQYYGIINIVLISDWLVAQSLHLCSNKSNYND